jgi:hypothetical protein
VDAYEQFVPQKRTEQAVRILYDPRLLVIDVFAGAEDGTADKAFAPPPHTIASPLAAGVSYLCFRAAIYTNHVNILSYGYKIGKWKTDINMWETRAWGQKTAYKKQKSRTFDCPTLSG